MRSLFFKGKMGLVFIVGFLMCFVLGCDKLNFLKAKQIENKEDKVIAQSVPKGPIVAKINNLSVSLEDLNSEVDAYNSMVAQDKPESKLATREKKIDYLKNEIVRRMLLYQAALDRGLDRSPEVNKALEKTKTDLLVVELIKQEADKVTVSSKEIEDYYNTYKEQLKEPEEVNLREIVVSSEPEAKEILVQILQGGDFGTIAKERSKSKSAKSGGDLGFVQKDKLFKEMLNVANTLEVGQTSSAFKGPEGFYIIKLEGKKGGKQKTLSELWEDIKRGLTFLKQQQQVEELIGKLSRQAKIEIYEGEIK